MGRLSNNDIFILATLGTDDSGTRIISTVNLGEGTFQTLGRTVPQGQLDELAAFLLTSDGQIFSRNLVNEFINAQNAGLTDSRLHRIQSEFPPSLERREFFIRSDTSLTAQEKVRALEDLRREEQLNLPTEPRAGVIAATGRQGDFTRRETEILNDPNLGFNEKQDQLIQLSNEFGQPFESPEDFTQLQERVIATLSQEQLVQAGVPLPPQAPVPTETPQEALRQISARIQAGEGEPEPLEPAIDLASLGVQEQFQQVSEQALQGVQSPREQRGVRGLFGDVFREFQTQQPTTGRTEVQVREDFSVFLGGQNLLERFRSQSPFQRGESAQRSRRPTRFLRTF